LDAQLLKLVELKTAALEQSVKQPGKKEPTEKIKEKNMSVIEEELNGNRKSLFSDDTDTPESGSGKKLWD
jgi:hypothetical protein